MIEAIILLGPTAALLVIGLLSERNTKRSFELDRELWKAQIRRKR